MVKDLFEDDITEEVVTTIQPKETIQTLCIYSEFIVLPSGEVKRSMVKSWTKGRKETKVMKSKILQMPTVEVGEEMLI